MAATRALVFVSVAVLLLLGAPASFHASTAGSEEVTVENESFTPDVGNYTELDFSKQNDTTYSEDVTVLDQNSNPSTEGIDYEWNNSLGEGTIKALSGGNLDGDNSAEITYGFSEPTAEHTLIRNTYGTLMQALPYLLAVIVAGMFVLAGRIF